MDPIIIGNRVKFLMNRKKMPKTKLAQELGISYRTLSRKLNGQIEFCNIELIKLQRIFDLNIEMFSNVFFNENFNLEEKLKDIQKIC